MIHALARQLARLLVAIFYRRLVVVGAHQIPPDGPLLVVANHHNALVDPLLVLAAVPRPLVPLAKAPLFSHPVMGPLLRAISAIPVARRQDLAAGHTGDPERNTEMFARAAETLRAGGAILIFPEGVSQAEPVLMPLRTGAARILLDAAADGTAVTLLPVGLVYEAPDTFRAGPALAVVGPPIETADLARAADRTDSAVRQLTDRTAAALRALIVEARTPQTAALLSAAEDLAEQEGRLPADDPAARAAWRRRAAPVLAAPEMDARADGLRRELRRLVDELDGTGLAARALFASYPPGAVLRYTWRQTAALLVALPAALAGLLAHAVPYRLTAAVARALGADADVAATLKLGVGLAMYPLCWLAEGWVAWRIGGPWLLAAFCAALIPGGLIALAWQERWDDFRRRALGFLHYLTDRDHHGHLVARRRTVVAELEALMARAAEPPSVREA